MSIDVNSGYDVIGEDYRVDIDWDPYDKVGRTSCRNLHMVEKIRSWEKGNFPS